LAPFSLVLSRFVGADRLAEEPDFAQPEADALELLTGRPLPAARLMAMDANGASVGVRAVLIPRLPGASRGFHRTSMRSQNSSLTRYADFHATAVPSGAPIRSTSPTQAGL
jgi:hypothetical protein